MTDAGEVVALLTELGARGLEFSRVAGELRKATDDKNVDAIRPFRFAFDYALLPSDKTDSLTAFVPMLGYSDGSSYPPALDTLDEAILTTWEEAADVDGPVVGARLHDLLWQRKHGASPHLHARAAHAAYLALVELDWEPIYRVQCVNRAIDIARALNDDALRDAGTAASIGLCRAELAAANPKPGVILALLGALVSLPNTAQPADVDGLLNAADQLFGGDAHLSDSLLDLRMAREQDENVKTALRRQKVELWREEAERAKGLGRYAHLRKALGFARDFGFGDVAERITTEMQTMSPDDLQTIASEFSLPTAEVEEFINSFLSAETWQDCLAVFGSWGPPSGDHKANLEMVSRIQEDHPLLFLITKVVYDRGGFPVQDVTTEEQHREVALSEQERMQLGLYSWLLARVLERIPDRYGRPETNDLAGFLAENLIPPDIAARIVAAFDLFWENRPDECAHVLTPRIEAVVRILANRAGIRIIDAPRAGKSGGVRPLGGLPEDFQDRDTFRNLSWTRYLKNLLVDRFGLNLRNDICHGIVVSVSVEEAALLLHAVCFLRNLTPNPESG